MKTCGSCKHWHKAHVPEGAPVDLSMTIGECRLQPHLALAGITPQGAIHQATYLQVPDTFPACSHHHQHNLLVYNPQDNSNSDGEVD